MKRIEEDSLKKLFNEYKILGIQKKVGGNRYMIATTTGDTVTAGKTELDDCDSSDDSDTTKTPPPLPFHIYNSGSAR